MNRLRSLTRCYKRSFCLSHVDSKTGTPVMVDVSQKVASSRTAHAQAVVSLPHQLSKYISSSTSSGPVKEVTGSKGPVFATAIIAGVMAAKKTPDLIPFCHPVSLEDCKITIDVAQPDLNEEENGRTNLVINCVAKTTHKTGVEMEAIVGATNAAVCIYDMLKAVSHDIVIRDVRLMSKTGGKSDFQRKNEHDK